MQSLTEICLNSKEKKDIIINRINILNIIIIQLNLQEVSARV